MSSLLSGVSWGDFNNIYVLAGVWIALALVASMISIRAGISVALSAIILWFLAASTFHLAPTEWINFLASFGSALLASPGPASRPRPRPRLYRPPGRADRRCRESRSSQDGAPATP